MTSSPTGYNDYRMPVPTGFQEVFSHFYYVKNSSGQTVTRTLLPSYQTILIFNFGARAILHSEHNAQIKLQKCIALGPIKKAFDYSLPEGSEILVVSFKDDAFYRFFGGAALAEHVPIDPDILLQQDCFTSLWNDLSKLNDNSSRINLILQFAEPYLLHRNRIAAQLANFDQQTLNPIKAIASLNNQTERNTQINHKKYFGYSAKEFNRYVRFLKAIELIPQLLARNPKIDWFEVITECGYYDQSQLIKDFKYYTNLRPSEYLKFQKDICL